MIIDQNICENLRNLFCDAVTKVFGSTETFIYFIEDYECSAKYDCYIDYSGENYIINRVTGEYINWYKTLHLGRCINISILSPQENYSKWFEDFLIIFKESGVGE